jgi:hypothetical protein
MNERLAYQRDEAAEAMCMSVDSFDRHVRPYVPVVYLGSLRLWPADGLRSFLGSLAVRPYDGTGSAKRPRDADTSGGMAQGEQAP